MLKTFSISQSVIFEKFWESMSNLPGLFRGDFAKLVLIALVM